MQQTNKGNSVFIIRPILIAFSSKHLHFKNKYQSSIKREGKTTRYRMEKSQCEEWIITKHKRNYAFVFFLNQKPRNHIALSFKTTFFLCSLRHSNMKHFRSSSIVKKMHYFFRSLRNTSNKKIVNSLFFLITSDKVFFSATFQLAVRFSPVFV